MKIEVANLIEFVWGNEACNGSPDEILPADIGARRRMSTMVYVAEIGTFKLPEMNVSNDIYPVQSANSTHRDWKR